tara:strand:- start:1906 stop:2586 length:681 start_codon:yes stop_codon:yes gene_type:complete
MGSWGYKVGESDTFADVYDHFFDEYNGGATPEIAAASVRSELADFFVEYDDQYDAHFALALAQWETQSLDESLLEKVEKYVESGADLKNWEERDADSRTLEKRATALSSFVAKLRTPRSSKKRRKRPKFDFRMDTLVEIPAPDGKKIFSVNEEFSNGAYIHTGASMMWAGGGGSVFYFTKQGVKVSAHWIDSKQLEVTIEKGIEYSKKDDWAFFCGDKVDVLYKEV